MQKNSSGICCEIALKWMPENRTDEKARLVTVLAWYCRAVWANVDPGLCGHMWPLLLTWFNFNPSMDK